MSEVRFKRWELSLKEFLSIPYYLALTVTAYIVANENILVMLIALLVGWYLNASVFWQLYRYYVVEREIKNYLFLYIGFFVYLSLIISIMLLFLEG